MAYLKCCLMSNFTNVKYDIQYSPHIHPSFGSSGNCYSLVPASIYLVRGCAPCTFTRLFLLQLWGDFSPFYLLASWRWCQLFNSVKKHMVSRGGSGLGLLPTATLAGCFSPEVKQSWKAAELQWRLQKKGAKTGVSPDVNAGSTPKHLLFKADK